MNFHEPDQARLIPALKVLGEPNRLRILYTLGRECRPVTDIIRMTGLGQTNVSFHLRVLREAGIVCTERSGAFICYSVADPKLLRILHDLNQWLEARQTSGTGNANARSRPTSLHPAAARTRQAP